MSKISIGAAALAVAVAAASFVTPVASAGNQATRTVLLNEATHLPNNRLMPVAVEIPVGGREGRHTHPGSLVVYVQEGAVSLYYEGRPETIYRVGESFFVEAGKTHEGINRGNVSARVLGTFLLEEGAPLVTQVEWNGTSVRFGAGVCVTLDRCMVPARSPSRCFRFNRSKKRCRADGCFSKV